jgi:hypothetical protein
MIRSALIPSSERFGFLCAHVSLRGCIRGMSWPRLSIVQYVPLWYLLNVHLLAGMYYVRFRIIVR